MFDVVTCVVTCPVEDRSVDKSGDTSEWSASAPLAPVVCHWSPPWPHSPGDTGTPWSHQPHGSPHPRGVGSPIVMITAVTADLIRKFGK